MNAKLPIVLGSLSIVLGCALDSREYSIVEGTPQSSDTDPERARLRQMQKVRAEVHSTWIPQLMTESQCTPEEVKTRIEEEGLFPILQVKVVSVKSVTWSENGCEATASLEMDAPALGILSAACFDSNDDPCEMPQKHQLCSINNLMLIAGERTSAVSLDSSFSTGRSNRYTFAPQSAAARSAVLKYARTVAAGATNFVAPMLRNAISNAEHVCHSTAGLKGLSTTYVELYHLYDELTDQNVAAEVAVADAQRSTATSLREGIKRSVEGLELSRVSAAHMLVGGNEGLVRSPDRPDTDPVVGFCSQPELGPGARKAVAVIRQSGIPPLLIRARKPVYTWGSTLDGFLSDLGGLFFDAGSVRDRLGEQPGYEAFNDALCASNSAVPCITGARGFANALGLTLDDFQAAREYLAEEITAFSRTEMPLNPVSRCTEENAEYMCHDANSCLNGECATRVRLMVGAGTVNPPRDLDATYWAALSGHTTDNNQKGQRYDFTRAGVLNEATIPSDLVRFVDAMYLSAQRLVDEASQEFQPEDEEYKAVVKPLELLLDGVKHARPGGFRYCDGNAIYVDGYTAADQLRIVSGEDGLRCAVDGHLEGAPCSQAFLDTEFTVSIVTQAGGQEFPVQGVFTTVPASVRRLYLVRPIRSDDQRPGSFQSLAGWNREMFTGEVDSEQRQCVYVPIVPYAQQRAADVIRPSPEWCSHQQVECDGSIFDERLPLENELSDNNDGIESSWKNYLALARQAADEADLIGKEYIQAALDADFREEDIELLEIAKRQLVANELERLQDICGTTIDVAPLMQLLDAQDLDWNPLGHGLTEANFTGALLEYARGGDYNRLSLCLGYGGDGSRGGVAPLVTLGDTALCVPKGSSGVRCDGIASCPKPISEAESCAAADSAVPLSYFPLEGVPPPDTSTTEVCRTFRSVRQGAMPVSALAGTTFFNSGNLRLIMERIGWEARLGGYSVVTLDGAPVYSTGDWWRTGDVDAGPSNGVWPCAPAVSECADLCMGAPCTNASSLFCGMQTNCNGRVPRAAINDRLRRAVLAARFLGTGSNRFFQGIKLPARIHSNIAMAYTPVSRRVVYEPNEPDVPIIVTDYPEDIKLGTPRFTVYEGSPGSPAWVEANGTETWLVPSGLNFGTVELTSNLYGWDTAVFAGLNHVNSYTVGLSRLEPSTANGFNLGKEMLRDPLYENPHQTGYGWVVAQHGAAIDKLLMPESPMARMPDSEHWGSLSGLSIGFQHNTQSVLDAMELSCELASYSRKQNCDPLALPVVDLGNLHELVGHIECAADSVTRAGAVAILQSVPEAAFDALRRDSVEGSFPAISGQIGVRISELRTVLSSIPSLSGVISTELGLLGDDVEAFRLAVERARNNTATAAQVAAHQEMIASSMAEAACMAIDSQEVKSFFGGIPIIGQVQYVAQRRVNDFMEKGPDSQCSKQRDIANHQVNLASVQAEGVAIDQAISVEQAVVAFRSSARRHGQTLADVRSQLRTVVESVDTKLAEIDTLRKEAQRVMYRAIFLSSEQAKNQEQISAAMRNRRDGTRARYRRAARSAKLMAFIAKRAIEQRIGMHLSDLREDLPLVDAPASWANSICAMDGIDYADLSDPDSDTAVAAYSDGFIGDYVRKLENFVESYRLTHDFHEGTDTAVVSLRDDVQGVRATCEVETGNLLRNSGDLSMGAPVDAAWFQDLCEVDASGNPRIPCVGVGASDSEVHPIPAPHPEFGWARGFRLDFGFDGSDRCTSSAATEIGFNPCGFRGRSVVGAGNSSGLAQRVALPRGRYMLSWYEEDAGTVPEEPGISIRFSDGSTLEPGAKVEAPSSSSDPWRRWFVTFDVPVEERVTLRFIQRVDSEPTRTIAAAMLEDISLVLEDAVLLPRPYVATGESTRRPLPVCEDTYGDVFRAKNWERKCLWLCSDGFSPGCGNAGGRQACFWETSFDLSQWGIEHGDALVSSGFARGNFNYRIESIGLNFVGTEIRNCSASNSPSGCYGGGFVPYSLQHHGPYYVRNHVGGDFKASLFTGNIEHARGLATERYLTNPLSSTDASLIEQYLRREFQGRPLDGQYVLRVWEEPGVDFNAIRDIQVVLGYRYWTRFN